MKKEMPGIFICNMKLTYNNTSGIKFCMFQWISFIGIQEIVLLILIESIFETLLKKYD